MLQGLSVQVLRKLSSLDFDWVPCNKAMAAALALATGLAYVIMLPKALHLTTHARMRYAPLANQTAIAGAVKTAGLC